MERLLILLLWAGVLVSWLCDLWILLWRWQGQCSSCDLGLARVCNVCLPPVWRLSHVKVVPYSRYKVRDRYVVST